ncbi:sulfatase [Pelagicoccus mobilis]|uniref:Sulfatase n=1 Tax=Pelagicoccus mobilis TaxID=415221 RepID=A0A934VR65_9BACT|nr:sulfatase [Pelagicoccus mobilis]MBK1877219.1 sulfatase [Pelagicoccus mobilis]
MKSYFILSFSLVLCLRGFIYAEDSERLNVLFIPIDDLKPLFGCYGDEVIQTPNIDRLSERGTVFLNNSCQQAVCGPSRASIMTGLYPDQTRVWDLVTKMRDINPDVLSLPQYFRQQGYQTTGLGKTYDPRCVDNNTDQDAPSWSVPYESIPVVRSMPHYRDYVSEETIETAKRIEKQLEGQVFHPKYLKARKMVELGGSEVLPSTECLDVPDDAYDDGAVASAAIKTLNLLAEKEQPFFLSVGFYKPHLPFAAPKKYWDLYDPEKIEIAAFSDPPMGSPVIGHKGRGAESGELGQYSDIPRIPDLPEDLQKRLIHGYMASVTYMDAQVGKVLEHLDTLGLTEKTIICLWGDHGFHLGDHSFWTKHTNYEQSVRSPLVFVSPVGYEANQTQSPTEFVDVFPTLCELAGLEIPPHLPGKSLVSLMKDPSSSVRSAALAQYPRGSKKDPVMGYSLRDERFRYTKWLQMDYRAGERAGKVIATELYDYESDPHETKDISRDDAFRSVTAKFEAIFKQRGVAQEK